MPSLERASPWLRMRKVSDRAALIPLPAAASRSRALTCASLTRGKPDHCGLAPVGLTGGVAGGKRAAGSPIRAAGLRVLHRQVAIGPQRGGIKGLDHGLPTACNGSVPGIERLAAMVITAGKPFVASIGEAGAGLHGVVTAAAGKPLVEVCIVAQRTPVRTAEIAAFTPGNRAARDAACERSART